MRDEGVPDITEFLQQNMKQGQTLGFDGRVISAQAGKDYEKKLEEKQISVVYDTDLSETIWSDRPKFPAGKVTVLDEKIAGRTFEEKRSDVMEKLEKEGADAFLLTKLDDLMWLFNIRGCDVECNPVAISYGYLSKECSVLFIQKSALDESVWAYLNEKGIQVEEYGSIVTWLQNLPAQGKILVDDRFCSYCLYKTLSEKQTLVEKRNPTEILKAIKNPVELSLR